MKGAPPSAFCVFALQCKAGVGIRSLRLRYGISAVKSTLADRLWWSRKRARVGANILAREVGCPQSLISSLERNNSDKSKYTGKFARALKVDPHWLATGNGPEPEGFKATEVRKARRAGSAGDEFLRESSVLEFKRSAARPDVGHAHANDDDNTDPVMLWVSVVPKMRQLKKLVGAKKFAALLESLEHLVDRI